MKKYSKTKHHELNELNITPLLDLCFVLLVIFILTTAPPVNEMDITLPTAAANPKEQRSKAYFVSINSKGEVSLNNVQMNEDQLLRTLVAFRKEPGNEDLSVVVRADSGIEVQRLVTVLDVLISANITKFGLSTDTAPAPVVH